MFASGTSDILAGLLLLTLLPVFVYGGNCALFPDLSRAFTGTTMGMYAIQLVLDTALLLGRKAHLRSIRDALARGCGGTDGPSDCAEEAKATAMPGSAQPRESSAMEQIAADSEEHEAPLDGEVQVARVAADSAWRLLFTLLTCHFCSDVIIGKARATLV